MKTWDFLLLRNCVVESKKSIVVIVWITKLVLLQEAVATFSSAQKIAHHFSPRRPLCDTKRHWDGTCGVILSQIFHQWGFQWVQQTCMQINQSSTLSGMQTGPCESARICAVNSVAQLSVRRERLLLYVSLRKIFSKPHLAPLRILRLPGIPIKWNQPGCVEITDSGLQTEKPNPRHESHPGVLHSSSTFLWVKLCKSDHGIFSISSIWAGNKKIEYKNRI